MRGGQVHHTVMHLRAYAPLNCTHVLVCACVVCRLFECAHRECVHILFTLNGRLNAFH